MSANSVIGTRPLPVPKPSKDEAKMVEIDSAEDAIGKCRVLKESLEGMMARVLHRRDMELVPEGKNRPQCLDSQDYAKVKKRLEYTFPEVPDAIRSPGAFETLLENANIELQGLYELFEEVLEVKNAAREAICTISGCSVKAYLELFLDANSLLMWNFMELVVAYVRLYIVVREVEERRMALGLYFASCNLGTTAPDSWKMVATFVLACDDPFRASAMDFGAKDVEPLRKCVHGVMLQVSGVIHLALQTTRLQQLQILNLHENDDALPLPAVDPVSRVGLAGSVSLYGQLCNAAKYVEWVQYSSLVIPGAVFCTEKGITLFRLVWSTEVVINVFRSVSFRATDAMDSLTSWFPPKGLHYQLAFKKKTKLTQITKEIVKEAIRSSAGVHYETRAYLHMELAELCRLMGSCPGLLGPKFPVILAALSMAKAEIMRYFLHHSDRPGAGKNGRLNNAWNDKYSNVSILIGCSSELIRLIRKYSGVVRRYFVEYLSGAHANTLRRQLLTLPSIVTESMSESTAEQMKGIADQLAGVTEDSDLSNFRWCCERICGALSRPEVSMKVLVYESVKMFLQRLVATYHHSTFVDEIESVLSSKAELSEAWWFLPSVKHEFEYSLTDVGPSSKYVISYLSVISSAMDTVHPFCPEEQLSIGCDSAHQAEGMAQDFAAWIGAQIEQILDCKKYLDMQTRGDSAAARHERAHTKAQQAKRGQMHSTQPDEDLPGKESEGWAYKDVQQLYGIESNVANLLGSLKSFRDIVVFDRLLVPLEFVREMLSKTFRKYMRNTLVFQKGIVERPTVALSSLLSSMCLLQRVMSPTLLDVNACFRRVLLEECTTWARDYGTFGSPRMKANIMDAYPKFYEKLLRDISPGGSIPGVVYVKERSGFVASPATPQGSKTPDFFLNEGELKAFCHLFGCSGARALGSAILKFITDRVKLLFDHLRLQATALKSFVTDIKGARWEQALQAISAGDFLGYFVSISIAIGNALILRRMLRQALRDVYMDVSPDLMAPVIMAREQVQLAGLYCAQGLEDFKLLVEDFGLMDKQGTGITGRAQDHSLALALQQWAGESIWEVLPSAFGASLAADSWKNCRYFGRLSASLGGEHALIVTMIGFFDVFFGKQQVEAMRCYVEVASRVYLHMKLNGSFKDYNFNAMMALMDSFVQEAGPELDRSEFEARLPYVLTNAAYLAMSKKNAIS